LGLMLHFVCCLVLSEIFLFEPFLHFFGQLSRRCYLVALSTRWPIMGSSVSHCLFLEGWGQFDWLTDWQIDALYLTSSSFGMIQTTTPWR
jgi:hypothetical protein